MHTRNRSPHTNGVVERWIGALKYERLYRHDIADGISLADHIADYLDEYNTIRPHQALAYQRPLDAYLTDPDTQTQTPKN